MEVEIVRMKGSPSEIAQTLAQLGMKRDASVAQVLQVKKLAGGKLSMNTSAAWTPRKRALISRKKGAYWKRKKAAQMRVGKPITNGSPVSRKNKRWMKTEDDFLVLNQHKSVRELKHTLGRTRTAIKARIAGLAKEGKMRPFKIASAPAHPRMHKGLNKEWTAEQDGFIKQYKDAMTLAELSARMQHVHSVAAISSRLARLGFPKGDAIRSLRRKLLSTNGAIPEEQQGIDLSGLKIV